jgi:hypothetical protein
LNTKIAFSNAFYCVSKTQSAISKTQSAISKTQSAISNIKIDQFAFLQNGP